MSTTSPDRPLPMLAAILTDVAGQIGATLLLDPSWKYAGQITFKSGKRAYFRGSSLDINAHGSSQIAKDKDYSAFFMLAMGFPAVEGRTFFSDAWSDAIGSDQNAEAAVRHAGSIGYPLIVKPNSASQGRGVFVVENEAELRSALAACFELDRVVLLQRFLRGRDYRVVVLGTEVISAYERVPLNVRGDGKQTIQELLQSKSEEMVAVRGRAAKIPFGDTRLEARIGKIGYSLNSIPANGEIVYLLDHANLSSGGDAIDVTGTLSPDIERVCIDVTRAMGLRLCGVDLIVDGDITTSGSPAHILEVNSSPGLDNYAAIGPEQWQRTRDLYAKVLRFIERS